MIRKRIKPRTASNMGELLSQEGSGSFIKAFKDIPIITPVKLDECDVLYVDRPCFLLLMKYIAKADTLVGTCDLCSIRRMLKPSPNF